MKIPLIEEEKIIALTQSSLLVEHNYFSSSHNSKKIVEPKHLFLECNGERDEEEKRKREKVSGSFFSQIDGI